MSNSISCPSCASNLKYNIPMKAIACGSCGRKFDPEEISYEKEDFDEFDTITCNNCGAEVIADKFTSATFCAYCGASTMVTGRLSEKFEPTYILPFEITREEALSNFEKFAKNVHLKAPGFLSKKTLEKMTPLYVPFWLFDVEAYFSWRGTGYMLKQHASKNRPAVADMYNISRSGHSVFTLVPLDAMNRVSDELMESVEPFDFHKLKDYHPGYISGFYANRYSIPSEKLHTRAKRRVEDYLDEMIKESVSEINYSKVENGLKNYDIGDPHCSDYALLPIWFLHYSYKGKSYDFAVNGQTGEVGGMVPQSKLKIILSYIVCMLPALLTIFLGIVPTLNSGDPNLFVLLPYVYTPLAAIFIVAGPIIAKFYSHFNGIEPKPSYAEYWRGGKYDEVEDRYINTIEAREREVTEDRFAVWLKKKLYKN